MSLAKTRMETFQDVQTGRLDVVFVTQRHRVEKRHDTHSVTRSGCSSGLAVLLLTDGLLLTKLEKNLTGHILSNKAQHLTVLAGLANIC